jgi:gamma-D-glutamyl-L-lysine dipeptidyl-peptidase
MRDVPEPGGRVAVRSAIAPLLGEPRISSSQTSQRVSGQLLEVIEHSGDDWMRVRGDDAYEGWVHRGYVDAVDLFEPDRPTILVSLGCVAERRDGRRRALPLGARLWPDERAVVGDTIALRDLSARFPAARGALTNSARDLFAGAPYQWGGVTPWGADCSGFVQAIFALHGMPLPRDAWQQALEGEDAGTDPAALEAGDLLFFSDRADGRITHIGISLGARSMVHCALGRGGNAVDDLGERDGYAKALRERFRFGRALRDWTG